MIDPFVRILNLWNSDLDLIGSQILRLTPGHRISAPGVLGAC